MSAFICGLLFPRFVCKVLVDAGTLPPTLAFSNVPGPLKKLSYKGCETLASYCGFIVAGKCGLSVNIISYTEKISFTIVSDTAVLEDPTRLKLILETAIREYIELGKKTSLSNQANKKEK